MRLPVALLAVPLLAASSELWDGNRTEDFPGACTISTGAQHLCGLEQATGNVLCWGSGEYGQLGDDRATSSDIPVLVHGLAPAVAVTAGGLHSCAIEEGGGAKCWGKGEDGQLGFGGRSRRWEARPVARLGPAADIRAGGSHTCALEVSGIVRCWGWGEFGQLGDGRALDSLYPVRVAHIEHADALCSGALHSCAVEDGMAKCWGWGERGQLGFFNGTRRSENSRVPVTVEGIEDVTEVACGYQHTCALHGPDNNQTTTCWGEGVDLQLQRPDEIWTKTARRVMRLDEILQFSGPIPTAPMKSVW